VVDNEASPEKFLSCAMLGYKEGSQIPEKGMDGIPFQARTAKKCDVTCPERETVSDENFFSLSSKNFQFGLYGSRPE